MSGTTLKLDRETAEGLIRRMTDGLVNIVDKTGEFLLRLDDGTVIDTKGWGGWEWTHGVALTALYNHGSSYSQKTILEWFEAQYKATHGLGAPKNINTMSPFYSLAGLLHDGTVKDERWIAWCDEWAEWVMKELPKTKEDGFQHITYSQVNYQQLWDDTLQMTVLPLAQIGRLLNRPHYIEEARYQFLLHVQYLMDTHTGLWFHGWTFEGNHNFANALWARGNCWITLAIPMFLDYVDGHDRRFLISAYKRQVDALVKLQDPENHMWHTLLTDPTSYVETSATAGFAAGIYMGIRMGILDASYRSTADKALSAVIANIQPDGEVAQVSFGTGMGDSLQFYKEIPITSMPYGQALAMLAIVEWQRSQN